MACVFSLVQCSSTATVLFPRHGLCQLGDPVAWLAAKRAVRKSAPCCGVVILHRLQVILPSSLWGSCNFKASAALWAPKNLMICCSAMGIGCFLLCKQLWHHGYERVLTSTLKISLKWRCFGRSLGNKSWISQYLTNFDIILHIMSSIDIALQLCTFRAISPFARGCCSQNAEPWALLPLSQRQWRSPAGELSDRELVDPQSCEGIHDNFI